MEKSPFTPSCLDKVKKLASQESTCSALLLIQRDEAASHIVETTTQAFKVQTDKESTGEESDGGMELNYGDSEKAFVLPDADKAAD